MSNTGETRADPEETFPLVPPEQNDPLHISSGSVSLLPALPDRQRLDQEQHLQEGWATSESRTSSKPSTGVAFSGGGIRSAAFCSGVLRWMLKSNFPMDYLSCVSGGGYTGAAFLDWKYHIEKKQDSESREPISSCERTDWQNEFFENMHQNAGYLCNFQKPFSAIVDSIRLIILVFFTVLVLPCLLWFPYAFPVAEAVDFLCGDLMREDSSCREPAQTTVDLKKSKSSYLLMELYGVCSPSIKRVILFTLTALLSLVFYIISRCKCSRRYKGHLRLVSILLFLLFLFTAVPWIAHDFLWPVQVWVQVVVFFICLVLPFFFPIIRNYAGMFLFFYVYGYIVSWKVFKIELLDTVPYSDAVFYPVLVVCCAFIVLFPFFGSVHRTLFNAYYRFSLSKAFFYPDPAKPARFQRNDVFPCCGAVHEGVTVQFMKWRKGSSQNLNGDEVENHGELTLGELSNLRPKFISNITVNDWQIDSRKGPSHHLIAFSTEEVKVIGKYVDEDGASVKPDSFYDPRDDKHGFRPGHMRLSHAMAISGAALSYDMGSYENRLDMVLDLLSLLGLGMGAEMPSDQVSLERDKEKPCYKSCVKVLTSFLLELFVCFPLIAILVCYPLGSNLNVITGLVLVHIGILVFLSFTAVQNTGAFSKESTCNKQTSSIIRWLIPRLFFVRFLRGFLNIPHVFTRPPPELRLSDGGHFENLALLPLLEKGLDYIVVADGSCNPGGEKYADALLHAIKKAREKLHCSFIPLTEKERKAEDGESGDNGEDTVLVNADEGTGDDGIRDIEEDIRVHFLTKKGGRLPRHYRFKVHYYDTDENGEDKFSGTGEILFLAPRHPSECEPETKEPEQEKKWKKFDVELGEMPITIEKPDKPWSEKPRKLTKDEANSLTWCCCRCCHGQIKEAKASGDRGSRLTCCRCQCRQGCCPCCASRCSCDCCPGDICHSISSYLLGGFPHHITGNQFFTPDMFSAYHREGLAACIEAEDKAKAFFKELQRNEES